MSGETDEASSKPGPLNSLFRELGLASPAEQPEGTTVDVSAPSRQPETNLTEGSRLEGRCTCGAVAYSVHGKPLRVGLCHCTDCRQESGSAFTYFAVWPADRFETSGETASHHGRQFCPVCGSRVFSANEREAEIKLGTLDAAPTGLRPTYELWVKRREAWMRPLEGCEQFEEDRTK